MLFSFSIDSSINGVLIYWRKMPKWCDGGYCNGITDLTYLL
jgi:hypothetical protein